MSDSQTVDGTNPASNYPAARIGRRKLMLGAAAAGAGAAVDLVVGGDRASASTLSPSATAHPLDLSKANTATATTSVTTRAGTGLQGSTSANGQSGLAGVDSSSSGGYGVSGTSTKGLGVYGSSTGNDGVRGVTDSVVNSGVSGFDNSGGTSSHGVYGISAAGYAIYGTSTSGTGVLGQSTSGDGVQASTSGNGACGVNALDLSSGGGTAVQGSSFNGTGVYGSTNGGGQTALKGVDGSSSGGWGVQGISTNGNGVYGSTSANGQCGVSGHDGSSDGGYGVVGSSTYGLGIYGTATKNDGVRGVTSSQVNSGVSGFDNSGGTNSHGVYGTSEYGDGVYGIATKGTGVFGSGDSNGVIGTATGDYSSGCYGVTSAENGIGVEGVASGSGQSVALYGIGGSYAVYALGNAEVNGTLSKSGGSFKIDHPLDPANKYLYHSFVESPDMMNVYNGNVVLDAAGQATVELPDWFETLNRDYRYQLTPIGGAAPGLHIAAEVAGGRLGIAGGDPGQKVSWQVTGIRQDAWANANRIPLEVAKPADDRGRYLHPELYGPGAEAITLIAERRRRLPA